MYKKLLDNGYVQLIEWWGSDQSIIEAARMSTDKGFLRWDAGECPRCLGDKEDFPNCHSCSGKGTVLGDERLLRYLYENKHSTPFEMAGFVIEVKAPIFVFREWHRHRTQSYNEMSARYTPLPNDNYNPTLDRLFENSKTNKQAGTIKGALKLTKDHAESYQSILKTQYALQEQVYRWAMDVGIPKELARIHLGTGRYSRMRASANLRNWLAFLTLRQAENAMWEIRQYAEAVAQCVAECFPRTYNLYCDNFGK